MPWSLRSFDVARFLNVQHRRQPGTGVGPLDARDPRHPGDDVADALRRGARPLKPAALVVVGGEVTREQLERADDDGEGVVDLVGGGACQERNGAQIGGLPPRGLGRLALRRLAVDHDLVVPAVVVDDPTCRVHANRLTRGSAVGGPERAGETVGLGLGGRRLPPGPKLRPVGPEMAHVASAHRLPRVTPDLAISSGLPRGVLTLIEVNENYAL